MPLSMIGVSGIPVADQSPLPVGRHRAAQAVAGQADVGGEVHAEEGLGVGPEVGLARRERVARDRVRHRGARGDDVRLLTADDDLGVQVVERAAGCRSPSRPDSCSACPGR